MDSKSFSRIGAVTLKRASDLLLFSGFTRGLSSFQASFRSIPIGSEISKASVGVSMLECSYPKVDLVTLLTVLNVFPDFFINGIGVTLTDQIVFSISVFFFALNSVFFLCLYLKSKSSVLYWFTLALALDALGTFGVTLQVRFSDIVVWTGRIVFYVATIYFLIALLSSRKQNAEN